MYTIHYTATKNEVGRYPFTHVYTYFGCYTLASFITDNVMSRVYYIKSRTVKKKKKSNQLCRSERLVSTTFVLPRQCLHK